MPFDLYRRNRRLGRFWTRDLGQEGLFLNTGAVEGLNNVVLELRFEAGSVEHSLRGVIVHQVRDEGVGIQLAYWRKDDRPAHLAYLELLASVRPVSAAEATSRSGSLLESQAVGESVQPAANERGTVQGEGSLTAT